MRSMGSSSRSSHTLPRTGGDKAVAKRDTYSDSFTGEADRGIRLILGLDDDEDGSRVRRVMLKIINNELTPRQKEIIMLYYFKDMDTVTIGKKLGVSSQAVCAVMSRARLKLYRFLQYYI